MRKLMLLAALLAMLIVAAVPAVAQISQENEQESESGDVNQSFEISGGGDNSNQCVGVQGIANTGNSQNQIGVLQYGSDADEFEFDEVDTSIEVSPEYSTTCDQQVNQAASASG
jgi:Tfp pilus assembly protein FimT